MSLVLSNVYFVTFYGIVCFIFFSFGQAFREAIKLAVKYKEDSTDFMDEVFRELEVRKPG